jgi:hypothetical protein
LFAAETEKNSAALEGTWRWSFTMPDAGKINPILRLKHDTNGWTGSTRFRPGSSAPITNLTFRGSQVSFDVVRERDGLKTTTHYAGTLSGDSIKGKMISHWQGREESYDWEARRLNDVEGVWKWRLSFGRGGPGGGAGGGGGGGGRGGGELTVTLKRDGDKVSGKLNAGRLGESDIHRGRFRKGELSFEVERERDGDKSTNYYRGKLAGDTIEGTSISTFGDQVRTNEWKAVRAD